MSQQRTTDTHTYTLQYQAAVSPAAMAPVPIATVIS